MAEVSYLAATNLGAAAEVDFFKMEALTRRSASHRPAAGAHTALLLAQDHTRSHGCGRLGDQ